MELFKKYFSEVDNCYVREFGENFLICENGKIVRIKKNTIQKSISRNYNQSFGYKWGYKEVM